MTLDREKLKGEKFIQKSKHDQNKWTNLQTLHLIAPYHYYEEII